MLFAAYSYAFDFSKTAGLVVAMLLCTIGPSLFMRAQQFKLVNTSWRGLRFDFDARTPEAIRVVLPILLLWFSATLLPIWYSDELAVLAWSQLGFVVPIPWMHHRLKSYQHRRARFGDRGFSFEPAVGGFYAVYGKGLALMAMGGLLGGAFAMNLVTKDPFEMGDVTLVITMILAALILMVSLFVFSWPYFAARLQQLTWACTRLGSIRFHTHIRARDLCWIALRNVFLTVVTLGLYWPFASIHLARYRIECMQLETRVPLAAIAEGARSIGVGASGEGAADAFGFDIGL